MVLICIVFVLNEQYNTMNTQICISMIFQTKSNERKNFFPLIFYVL